MTAGNSEKVERFSVKTLFWSIFWSTIIILAALYGYANLKLAKLSQDDQGRVLVTQRYYDEWRQTLPEVFVGMGAELDSAGNQTEDIIAEKIDNAFAPVYDRIPVFLKFHYSVVGEYLELSAALSDDAGAELKRILFDEVDFEKNLNSALNSIQSESDAVLSTALARINDEVQAKLDLDETELALLSGVVTLTIDDATKRFEGGELMLKSAGAMAGAGAMAAVMTKTIGKKIAAKVAAKATAKTAVKAATGVGGGAASGAAAGAVCGPLVWVCAPVGGVVGAVAFWLVTDKAIIEVDEYLNHESFEAELRTVVDDEKAQMKMKLIGLYQNRIQAILDQNKTTLRGITTRQLIKHSESDY